MNYGIVIGKARKQNGLSIQELALLLHVKASVLQEWEAGSSVPNLMQVPLLCAALRISYEAFFGLPARSGRSHRRMSDELNYQYSWLPGMYRYLIHDRRIKRKITTKQLADTLGLPESTVLRWESGKAIPRLDDVPSLCLALRIRLWQFFE